MTEPTVNSATAPPESASLVNPTAGTLLRLARENAGMHLGMLSVALKVPVRSLMALESDRYEQLSGAVFVRALAGSVCRHLKIDSGDILALLPQAPQRLAPMQAGLESPPREVFAGLARSLASSNRRFLLTSLALITLILLIIWLPSWPTPPTAPVLAQPAPTDSAVTTVMPSELPVPPVAARANASVIAPDPAAPAVVSGQEVALVFKGKSDSWVEVKNSTGAVVFSQLVRAGETHQVKAEPLLNVVIGMADGVDVQVRGQAFDLTPFSRGAVARFEVK